MFKIQINKKLIKLLFILKKYNVISSFMLLKNKSNRLFVLISPSYNKHLFINFFFKSFYLATKRFQMSLKALKLLKDRTGNSIYLISSSRGIIDHKTALVLKKSGFLMGIIHS